METQIPEEIQIYIDSLLMQKNLHMAPDQVKQKLVAEIYDTLEDWLLADFANAMPNNVEPELEKFADSNPSQEQMIEFYKKILPNYDQVMQDSLKSFSESYLS